MQQALQSATLFTISKTTSWLGLTHELPSLATLLSILSPDVPWALAVLPFQASHPRSHMIGPPHQCCLHAITEKLLLYGGAIHEAGAVKARRAARHATSDWMELEKQRGISITSTALVFETEGYQITLLDTPGHQDFGEDTYRTLAAADNAVMLVDAGKGLEPQTRKLFEVCRMRKLPIFTFINKMDRPALQALELLDEIEKEFELSTHAISWPIGSGDRFMGLYYRPNNEVHLFEKDQTHGSKEASVQVLPWGDPSLQNIIPEDLYQQLEEEIELLEAVSPPLELEKIHEGELSPVFFGSAMNNFGVKLFLESFLKYAQEPGPHVADAGLIEPDYPEFTGFVFKLQANMDPKHRDKVAFVRVCSDGQPERGKFYCLGSAQMLWSEHKATWEHYLRLVEYAYNNTVHTSTGKAPFEIVEGGKKVPPILQTKDKIFEADKYVQNTDEAYKKIKLALEKT
ncbi:hypothetical protein L7F22_005947 [Adiantum nelumboides]|nr:hypothetical protein [Adiantum nelumboides]